MNLDVSDSNEISSSTVCESQGMTETFEQMHLKSIPVLPDNSPELLNESQSLEANSQYIHKQIQELKPHSYQLKIFNKIKHNWQKESPDQPNGMQYGNIVYLETGTGKTYIAIMLIKHLFGDVAEPPSFFQRFNGANPDMTLTALTDQEIFAKKSRLLVDGSVGVDSIISIKNEQPKRKKVIFVVPTQNLVEQQASTIDRFTNLNVGRYHGGQKQKKFYTDYQTWQREFENRDVMVAMAKKFYDLLTHGFVKMEEIDLIVFDECHHTDQDHLYNLIMIDFFFHDFKPKESKRPQILGLTASPIKQKIDKQKIVINDIENLMQNLADNLYSRFVTISKEEIEEYEKELKMDICVFDSNFQQNINTVKKIEDWVIKPMISLINIPKECYKRTDLDPVNLQPIDQSKSVLSYLNDQAINYSFEQTDQHVQKFLNGRRQLIELDSSFTRQKLDISQFKTHEDQVLIFFMIIVLKCCNNLLIELGPLAVKALLSDLKQDLLQNNQQLQLGDKRDQTVAALSNFINPQAPPNSMFGNLNQEDQVSNKVLKLKRLLEDSHDKNNAIKTIIFVKDRSVAVYLKKLLEGDGNHREQQLYGNESFRTTFNHGLLDPNKFKVELAMGRKSKSLVGKAYRSTKKTDLGLYQDVLQKLPSCTNIKISNNQLTGALDKFRAGRVNVLIATNVVEEGLDVSTCNQVICLNEFLTVKVFIQMKGRARQKNSKFVFLCAKQEQQSVQEDYEQFQRVIQFMKQIAVNSETELLPRKDIVQTKKQDESLYMFVHETQAKVSIRDAKQLVDQFCLLCMDQAIEYNRLKSGSGPNSRNSKSVKSEDQSSITNSTSSSLSCLEDSIDQQVKHYDTKPNYLVKEIIKNGVKYFYCVLYMPLTCKGIITKVNPKFTFIKKRDAENHVALLCLRKLRKRNYLDDYLFPKNVPTQKDSNSTSYKKQMNELTTQFMSTNISDEHKNISFDSAQPRKTKYVTEEHKKKQREEQKKFHNDIKYDRLDQLPNQVNQLDFNPSEYSSRELCRRFQDLNVYVFEGKERDDNYPYRDVTDFIGVLFNRKFTNPCLTFQMYQENKQMQKNQEHLNNLVHKHLIRPETRDKKQQTKECLQVSLKKESVFKVNDNLNDKSQLDILNHLAKLNFFHVWMFYYLYSADHMLYKTILQRDFQFADKLFGKDIDFLNKKYDKHIKCIYSDNDITLSRHIRAKKKKSHNQYIELSSYTVPITRQGGRYQVNWKLIDRVIDYVRNRLYEVALPTERHVVTAKYDLEEVVKKDRTKMVTRLWDQNFQGNRLVVLDQDPALVIDQGAKTELREWACRDDSQKIWHKIFDLNQSKKTYKQELQHFKENLTNFMKQQSSYSLYQNSYSNSSDPSQISLKASLHLSVESKSFGPPPDSEFIQNQSMNPVGLTDSLNYSAMNSNASIFDMSMRQDKSLLSTSYTPQEYYFLNWGVYQCQRFNKYIVKCRKERQFVDFGKKRKEEIEGEQETRRLLYNPSLYSREKHQIQQRKVNTQFDFTDQMLSLSPLSYNQYQVLQQACFHNLNFNEFLLIEKFIDETFSDMQCLLDPNSQQPSTHATDVFHSCQEVFEREERKTQSKLTHQVEIGSAKDQMHKRMDLVREALTAPSACRDYDYERLEFYGDSIIGFLVILELFLTELKYQEGDLDYMRIERVSNMRFYNVNKQQNFFKYMITEPQNVFSGFLPVGFSPADIDQQSYHKGVTQKNYNELNNKLRQLYCLQLRLGNVKYDKSQYSQDLKQLFLNAEFYTLIRIMLKDKKLLSEVNKKGLVGSPQGQKLLQLHRRQDQKSVNKAMKLIFQSKDFRALDILKFSVDHCIENVKTKLYKQREQKSNRNKNSQFKKKNPYYKQLADQVESVTGAATRACGLNLTQKYLQTIGILGKKPIDLRSALEKLTEDQKEVEQKLTQNFFVPKKMDKVERTLGYTFQCKSWLVEALTHKSSIDQSIESHLQLRLKDYERLEFLGDSVLNYLVAKHFFLTTEKDAKRKMPKELHKMKTSVINNALLSLIVIENDIHNHIIYNHKASAFKEQFENYVNTVQRMVKECGPTLELCKKKEAKAQRQDQSQSLTLNFSNSIIEGSEQSMDATLMKIHKQLSNQQDQKVIEGEDEEEANLRSFDIDLLYEHNLKIFGDIFESLIGAVFLDSKSIDQTWDVLFKLIQPYMVVYADLETLQDHSRTKLLELWNQKSYTKQFKCKHASVSKEKGEKIEFTGIISYPHFIGERAILTEVYSKEAKNKVRSFYKKFYELVKKFTDSVDQKGEAYETQLIEQPKRVVQELERLAMEISAPSSIPKETSKSS